MTALADDLRRYLAHEPIGARPDTLAYRTAKFVRRHASGVAAGAGVVVLIASLVVFYTVQARRGARSRAHRSREVGARSAS